MGARATLHAPAPSLASPGLGHGWEPAALIGATLILLAFGLVTLWSASTFLARDSGYVEHFFVLRQAMGAAFGLAVLAVCARVPTVWWRALAWPMMFATIGLLILVIIPATIGIAPEINGARRWIRIGGVTFQPSEFAKIAVLVWTAHLAVKKRDQFQSLRYGMGPFLIVWAAVLIPITLQPDLSTAMLIAALGGVVVFLAGGRIAHFAFLGVLATPVLWLFVGSGFRWRRLLAFFDSSADAAGAGYQVTQSLIAVGSGGLTGVGFGEGRQKYGFLPEPHNDFIFSMIGEEWGLIGVCLIVGLYLGIVLVGFRIARRAVDPFSQLLAAGLASLVGLHAFLHMAVGLGLVPTTGLPLPLISYGRSNLVVTLAAIGMLMAISREGEGLRGARG